jgi:hypothetical protein
MYPPRSSVSRHSLVAELQLPKGGSLYFGSPFFISEKMTSLSSVVYVCESIAYGGTLFANLVRLSSPQLNCRRRMRRKNIPAVKQSKDEVISRLI